MVRTRSPLTPHDAAARRSPPAARLTPAPGQDRKGQGKGGRWEKGKNKGKARGKGKGRFAQRNQQGRGGAPAEARGESRPSALRPRQEIPERPMPRVRWGRNVPPSDSNTHEEEVSDLSSERREDARLRPRSATPPVQRRGGRGAGGPPARR